MLLTAIWVNLDKTFSQCQWARSVINNRNWSCPQDLPQVRTHASALCSHFPCVGQRLPGKRAEPRTGGSAPQHLLAPSLSLPRIWTPLRLLTVPLGFSELLSEAPELPQPAHPVSPRRSTGTGVCSPGLSLPVISGGPGEGGLLAEALCRALAPFVIGVLEAGPEGWVAFGKLEVAESGDGALLGEETGRGKWQLVQASVALVMRRRGTGEGVHMWAAVRL